MLRAMGFKGMTVQDEHELRTALSAVRPSLVILDLQANGVKPHTVVQAARDSAPGRVVPILAFGPHIDLEKRREALAAGCHRVVAKSVIASELPQLIKSILRT
jgi:hypothetical protein